MVIVIWVVTAILVALWSLAGWGLHALLGLGTGWTGEVQGVIDQVPYGDVIEAWIPGWQQMLTLALDLAQAALGWLGGAAPLIAWIVWGLGTAALLITAAVLTLIVALLRRSWPQRPAAAA
jgi:hypothetical protein